MHIRIDWLLAMGCVVAPVLLAGVHGTDNPGLGFPATGDIYVANLSGNNVTYYDGTTGAYKGEFVTAGREGLTGATGIAFSPAGELYVSSSGTNRILQFDDRTGSFQRAVGDDGTLSQPFSLTFGPTGDIYVSSGSDAKVLRYASDTGIPMGTAAEGEGMRTPIGLEFDDRGMLWVANAGGNSVRVHDPDTGNLIREYAHPELKFPSDVKIAPDGVVYVSNAMAYHVVAFRPEQPDSLTVVATLPDNGVPVGLDFGSDSTLFIADFVNSRLYKLNLNDGDLRLFATEGLSGPENIAVKR